MVRQTIATPVLGQRFGRWGFLEEVRVDGERRWRCHCACGVISLQVPNNLISGASKGCLRCSFKRKRRLPPLRCSWVISNAVLHASWTKRHREMMRRCDCPAHVSYARYGGRGIYYAERFRDRDFFLSFIQTLPGWDDLTLSLDRIDNDGPYVPGNLRMATGKMQYANSCRKKRAA